MCCMVSIDRLISPGVEKTTGLLQWYPPCSRVASVRGEATMPTYEYRCEKCRAMFTRRESFSEHEKGKPHYPKCGSKKVSPVPTAFSVVTSKKS